MQLGLFHRNLEKAAAVRRLRPTSEELGSGAWLERTEGWVEGAQSLFQALLHEASWAGGQSVMYQRLVPVPRLMAKAPVGARVWPVLLKMGESLSERYGLDLSLVTLALYRDGRDSVAMHGDRLECPAERSIVAIVSLGEARPFVMRPVRGSGTRVYRPGFGDLLVMGGTCQHTWLHGVPKQQHAGPRIAVMFRERVG
jgi:alkylated DNA repair dioxygenase AlkB